MHICRVYLPVEYFVVVSIEFPSPTIPFLHADITTIHSHFIVAFGRAMRILLLCYCTERLLYRCCILTIAPPMRFHAFSIDRQF